MSIKGLTDRGLAFPEIGQIRKGGVKSEKAPGRDLDYFRVEFDEREVETSKAFKAVYGEKPTEIHIILPFNDIERMWEAWLEAYTAGRMVARADGEKYIYLVDTKTGEVVIKNGLDKNGRTKPYFEGEVVGYDYKNKPVKCKANGRLKVIIPELGRAAYMTALTTSVLDIANISSQLAAFKQLNGGQIAGIPLVLRRRPKKISTPKGDGSRIRVTKWMLSIEADPAWVKAKLTEVKRLALPGNGLPLLPESTLQPTETESEEEYVVEYSEIEDDDEYEETPVDEETHPAPPANPPASRQNVTRPYPPELLPVRLREIAEQYERKGTTPKDVDRNMISVNLEACFAGNPDAKNMRHSILRYLFDVTSSKDLTDSQVLALKSWLNAQPDSGGEWKPDPMAVKEANAAFTEALKAAGQTELPLS